MTGGLRLKQLSAENGSEASLFTRNTSHACHTTAWHKQPHNLGVNSTQTSSVQLAHRCGLLFPADTQQQQQIKKHVQRAARIAALLPTKQKKAHVLGFARAAS